jgi:hypothetical protein
MSDTIQSAEELIAGFNLSYGLNCPNCPDQGWFADGPTDDPEQIQCKFCETEENSIFNIKRRIKKLIESRDAEIRADEARKQAERFAACEKERNRYLAILKTLHDRGPALEGFVDDPDDCWDYGASLFGDEEDPQDDDPRWFEGWINMIEAAQKRDAKALADLEATK